VNFALSDEQALLRDGVRRFLGAHAPMATVRRASESGSELELWRRMASELSLSTIGIPDEHGGSGGLVELAIVAEELGRTLACAPWIAHVLATRALVAVSDTTLLPRIAGGALATLGLGEGRSDALDEIHTTAVERDGAWSLSGHKPRVLAGEVADILLVVARANDGLGLFVVEGECSRVALPTMDPTRGLARVELASTRARPVGRPGDDGAALSRALDEAAIVLSAEMLGTAERAFELTLEYARTREQFGRPIGSFQAIKHACADVLVSIESARSAVLWAAWVAAEGADELATAASIAKATASEAAFHATSQAIQIHGGVGFTWEHDAHLFFKRARASAAMLGDATEHRARVAHTLLDH